MGKSIRQTGQTEDGLPVFSGNGHVADTTADGLPIFKKKVDGSHSPSDSSPNQTQTGQPVGTSDSDQSGKQLTTNYKNNSLTPEDVHSLTKGPTDIKDWNGLTPEKMSHGINNKGKNLSKWADAPADSYVASLLNQQKEAQKNIEQMSTRQSMVGDVPNYEANIKNFKDQEAYLRNQIQKSYDIRKEKVVPELLDNLKKKVDVDSWVDAYGKPDKEMLGMKIKSPLEWNPTTHKLTDKSVEWVAKNVDDALNRKGDTVINAQVSGDLDKKDRTYQDVTRSVVDYLNTIPIRKAQEQFTKEYTEKNPKLKDAFTATQKVNEYFSKDKVDAVKAKVNVDRDKEFMKTGQKYYGEGGVFYQNQDFIGIQHKYAQLVADGKMTDEVAKKQIQAEIKENPALKKINENMEAEIRKINEKTQTEFQNYIVSGLRKDQPKLTIYKDGTVGVSGLSKDQYTNMIEGYEEGLNDVAKKMGAESQASWERIANNKAKSVGAFWGSAGASLNDLTGAFSKFIFNKTQWGAKNVQYYEGQEIASPQINQSQVAASWNWKGIESLKDPNFWLSKTGAMVPVIAGATAVGLATDGAGMPGYIGWLANAGLFTAQSGLSTYNQLLNTRDAQGNLLTESDASHYMASQMEKDFLPNVLMMAATSGTLLKAKNIARPSLLATAGKGLAGAAIAQPFFTWQGYNDYATMQEAEGKKVDFWDYMQSKDFKDNLINGMVIGGGLSLLHAPGNYMKSVDNWTKMIHTSEGEFKNLIPQNYALGQEMAGGGNYLRDALKLKIFNTDPSTLDEQGKRELADAKNQLLYSTNLDRNIKQGNLDPKNIKDLYQAHNLALADQHDYLSDQAAKEGNKSLSDIYKDKAKDYREQAKAASNGEAKYHYLVNDEGHPIFMSDKSFKTLEAEGTIAKWMRDETIKDVVKSDDPEFAQRYKDFVKTKEESTVEGTNIVDHASALIEENKDKLGVYYGKAKENPEFFYKEVSDQVFGRNADGSSSLRPDAEVEARVQYGDDIVDAAKIMHPQTEEPTTPKGPTVQSAIIKVGGKIYEGENHKEAIDKAEAAGEDVSGIDREKDGLFKVSDGRIITREEAKKEFGADHSHDLIDSEYKPNIRDDYFAKADFFTPEEKSKFETLDDAGKDKMIDDKRAELKSQEQIKPNENEEIERKLPDTLSPEEKRGSIAGGKANAEATAITGRIHRTEPENEKSKKDRPAVDELAHPDDPREIEALKKYAKENGLWVDKEFGKPDASGMESSVYFNPETQTVTKVNIGTSYESWNEVFHRIAIHNALFPDTKYELKGFTEHNGRFAIILEQPLIIEGDKPLTNKDLEDDLTKRGFHFTLGKRGFYNKDIGVTISDVDNEGGNVILGSDGNIHYIDPVITKDSLEGINEQKNDLSNIKTKSDGKTETKAEGRQDVLTTEEGADKQNIDEKDPAPTSPPPPVIGPTEIGLHPRDNEWTSIQKKDLSERVQKENAFTQTNRESVDKVIGRLSRDASANGRTWQSQAEFETNALHNEFFNADGSIRQAFNPTTEELALIGIRLMDINGESSISNFNPNDEQQTARNAYLENEKMKAERLLSFGEAGRAFQFRQSLLKMGINGDIQIKRKAISSMVGTKIPETEEQFNELNDFDKQRIKPIYDAFQKWKSEYEKENKARNTVDDKYSQQEFDKRIKAAVADALKEAKIPEKASKITKESSKKISDSLKSFADKFEKFGKADLQDGTQKAGFAPDIQKKIADAIRWIAEKIANGDIKIPELISEAIERFKDKDLNEADLSENIKKGLMEAGLDGKTLNAPTNREGILGKMKEIAKNAGVRSLTKDMVDKGLVRDYLHDIAKRGVVDPKDILEKGVSELSKEFPGTDAKILRDAYLKEGTFTPDKSKDLEDQIKRSTQTFHDVTVLQRDIEALELGGDLYGADKEKKNTIISDYEKKLREEKEQLIKDRDRSTREIKDEKRKADKIAEYDRRIKDLDNHQKVWDRAKKGKGVDKDLAAKREELRKALIKNGVKLETGSKDARQTKEKVIEAHNDRVNHLKDKITDLLNDDTVPDEDKKALRAVKDSLDKMDVKIDAGELDDKIRKAISASGKLHSDNITNLVTGRKSEILKDLKVLSTQLKKDNNSGLQDIQLEQLKKREISRKEQAERKLASGQFDDVPKLSDYKKDEELLKLSRDRKMAESNLAREVDRYEKQNQSFWQRQITRLQRLQRANLISGIMTNGKVLVATVVKPVSDALVRRTIGTVTEPIFKKLGLRGDREVLNNDATIKSFVDSFKGMTQRQAAEKKGTAEAGLEKATIDFQAANDQLKALETQYGKDKPEYQQYKDNEYTKAVNDFQAAQYDWAASMMYDFISPRAWSERLRILRSGVSSFEESMGGHKGQTWADEKSVHAAGTIANKIIHTLEIFGRVHGAEKDISARQAFVEGFLKRSTERIKAGEQLTPSKLEGIALESYPNFLGGKFQNKNPISDAIRSAEMKASESGGLGKAFAFWLKAVTPVLKVPLNIEAEGLFKYTAGLPVAIGKTFYEIGRALKANDLTIKDGIKDFNGTMEAVREHMQGLSPEKRDLIIQYANKGIFGAAMALITGSMAASGNLIFGGAYEKGKKKREYLDAETGEMETLNYGEIALNGHKLGKFWSSVVLHLPPLMPAVMSATYVQKYKDERGDEKDQKGVGLAAWDGLSEVVRTAWEESALRSLGDVVESPGNIFNSFTTQMAAKNIAEYFDTDEAGNLVERKGADFWDKILLRTGGRKFVPTKEEYENSRSEKQDEKSDKAKDYKEGDLYYEKNKK